jgi:hypothetical protein
MGRTQRTVNADYEMLQFKRTFGTDRFVDGSKYPRPIVGMNVCFKPSLARVVCVRNKLFASQIMQFAPIGHSEVMWTPGV